ncbi:hypothetical protein GCM10028857_15670 [Salinarchaeum chitinilyticum]
MADGFSVEYDDPEDLPPVTFGEIFDSESIERYPEKRIVIVDGEARLDPFAEFATD